MLDLITVTAAALAAGLIIFYRRKAQMSQASVDRLTAAAKAATDKITSLTQQLTVAEAQNASLTEQLSVALAAAGTPDTVLDPISSELEQATANPPAPTPVPSPTP